MSDNKNLPDVQESLDEFSIMELDERLEFVAWCDSNCNCTGKPSSN